MKRTSHLRNLKIEHSFQTLLEAKGEEEMLGKKVAESVELSHMGMDYDFAKGTIYVYPCGACGLKNETSFLFMQRSGTEFSLDYVINRYKVISELEILHKKVADKGNPRYQNKEGYTIFGTAAVQNDVK